MKKIIISDNFSVAHTFSMNAYFRPYTAVLKLVRGLKRIDRYKAAFYLYESVAKPLDFPPIKMSTPYLNTLR